MGSDRLNWILTRFYFFSPVGVSFIPLNTHDSDPIYPVPIFQGFEDLTEL